MSHCVGNDAAVTIVLYCILVFFQQAKPKEFNYRVEWCLTIPPQDAPTFALPGTPAVVLKSKNLIFVSVAHALHLVFSITWFLILVSVRKKKNDFLEIHMTICCRKRLLRGFLEIIDCGRADDNTFYTFMFLLLSLRINPSFSETKYPYTF